MYIIDSEVMTLRIYWKIRNVFNTNVAVQDGGVSPSVHNTKLKIIYGLKMSKTADLEFRHYTSIQTLHPRLSCISCTRRSKLSPGTYMEIVKKKV